jgi:hypothetical protein
MRVMHVNVHPHSHSQIQFTFCHDFSSHSVTTFMYMMLCATYIHTHIHTYIHAYTHTYIHTCAVCAISASSVGGTLQRPGRVGLVKTLSQYPALKTSNWSKLEYAMRSMRSMRGGFIFRSRGPSLKVHHGQCLTSVTKHDTGGSPLEAACRRQREAAS